MLTKQRYLVHTNSQIRMSTCSSSTSILIVCFVNFYPQLPSWLIRVIEVEKSEVENWEIGDSDVGESETGENDTEESDHFEDCN